MIEIRADMRWPEDAIAVLNDIEEQLDGSRKASRDLALVARMLGAKATAEMLEDTAHDVTDAMRHVQSLRRGLLAAGAEAPA